MVIATLIFWCMYLNSRVGFYVFQITNMTSNIECQTSLLWCYSMSDVNWRLTVFIFSLLHLKGIQMLICHCLRMRMKLTELICALKKSLPITVQLLKLKTWIFLYKPQLVQYDVFPSIDLEGDLSSGIFSAGVCSDKKPVYSKKTAGGYCECCDAVYDSLESHLAGSQHQSFKSNQLNCCELVWVIEELALDSLVRDEAAIVVRLLNLNCLCSLMLSSCLCITLPCVAVFASLGWCSLRQGKARSIEAVIIITWKAGRWQWFGRQSIFCIFCFSC